MATAHKLLRRLELDFIEIEVESVYLTEDTGFSVIP